MSPWELSERASNLIHWLLEEIPGQTDSFGRGIDRIDAGGAFWLDRHLNLYAVRSHQGWAKQHVLASEIEDGTLDLGGEDSDRAYEAMFERGWLRLTRLAKTLWVEGRPTESQNRFLRQRAEEVGLDVKYDRGDPLEKWELFMSEKIELRGSIKKGPYQRLVAASYVLAPEKDERAIPLYRELAGKVAKQHKQLSTRYDFKPTEDDPYASYKDMRGSIDQQRQAGNKRPELKVYAKEPKGENGHPAISNDENVMLRGVHDAIAHLAGGHTFSTRGEYGAYNRHLKTLPNSVAPILFTEIVGQIAYHAIYNDYAVQKAAFLPDFDPFRVGALAQGSKLNRWFVLHDKVLQPRRGFTAKAFAGEFPELADKLNSQPGFHLGLWNSYDAAQDPSATRKAAR